MTSWESGLTLSPLGRIDRGAMNAVLPATRDEDLASVVRTVSLRRPRTPIGRLVVHQNEARGPTRDDGCLQFPLSHRAGTVVLLDDDPDFLVTLGQHLRRTATCTAFTDAESALAFVRREQLATETELAAQQRIVDAFRTRQEPLIPQILAHWAMRTHVGPASVIVIDHDLGGRYATDFLRPLSAWSGKRLLISGGASNTVAIAAFNERLIDSYLPKAGQSFFQELSETVDNLLHRPRPGVDDMWLATLNTEQLVALRQPEVASELAFYCRANFTEWVVIGEPFGILGRTRDNGIAFVQLALRSQFNELADIAEAEEMSIETCEEIREGRVLVDFDLQRTMGNMFPATVEAASSVGGRGNLLAAVRRVM
jgi:hypothetical protein